MKSFRDLSPRERRALWIAGAALLAFAVLRLAVLPLWDGNARLKKNIAAQKAQLAEMRAWAVEAPAIGGPAGGPKVPPGFSLFAYLDEAAAASRVKPHIRAMQPARLPGEDGALPLAAVDLRLQGLGLAQLTEFLRRVESPEFFGIVRIERLTVQGGGEGKPLDASLRVLAPEPPQSEETAP